jgi:hypothetical protein
VGLQLRVLRVLPFYLHTFNSCGGVFSLACNHIFVICLVRFQLEASSFLHPRKDLLGVFHTHTLRSQPKKRFFCALCFMEIMTFNIKMHVFKNWLIVILWRLAQNTKILSSKHLKHWAINFQFLWLLHTGELIFKIIIRNKLRIYFCFC